MAKPHVGIDVAKDQLDVWVWETATGDSVSHNEAGIEALCARLEALAPDRIVVEATGGREVPLAAALQAAGLPVAALPGYRRRRTMRWTVSGSSVVGWWASGTELLLPVRWRVRMSAGLSCLQDTYYSTGVQGCACRTDCVVRYISPSLFGFQGSVGLQAQRALRLRAECQRCSCPTGQRLGVRLVPD